MGRSFFLMASSLNRLPIRYFRTHLYLCTAFHLPPGDSEGVAMLQSGDVLLKWGEQALSNTSLFTKCLAMAQPGDLARLEFIRCLRTARKSGGQSLETLLCIPPWEPVQMTFFYAKHAKGIAIKLTMGQE